MTSLQPPVLQLANESTFGLPLYHKDNKPLPTPPVDERHHSKPSVLQSVVIYIKQVISRRTLATMSSSSSSLDDECDFDDDKEINKKNPHFICTAIALSDPDVLENILTERPGPSQELCTSALEISFMNRYYHGIRLLTIYNKVPLETTLDIAARYGCYDMYDSVLNWDVQGHCTRLLQHPELIAESDCKGARQWASHCDDPVTQRLLSQVYNYTPTITE